MFFIETYALVDLDLYIIPLMCIMCVAIPFVLVTIAPRFIPAEEVNLFFLLETIIGPFWVWMVIKEQPSIETITGGASNHIYHRRPLLPKAQKFVNLQIQLT
jgi:drug/metabolite transporter (DMT)-like permease